MIVVTVFYSILNLMEIHVVQNRKENCHHDHIPFHLKGNRIQIFSVCGLGLRGVEFLIGLSKGKDLPALVVELLQGGLPPEVGGQVQHAPHDALGGERRGVI